MFICWYYLNINRTQTVETLPLLKVIIFFAKEIQLFMFKYGLNDLLYLYLENTQHKHGNTCTGEKRRKEKEKFIVLRK